MFRSLLALTALAAGLGLPAAHAQGRKAAPDRQPGQLDVYDEAKLFSPAGVDQAKQKLRQTEFHGGLTVTVDTVNEPPANKKAAAEAAAQTKDAGKWRAFMLDWAREQAKADRARGVYVLVTTHPVGGVAVIADRQTSQRGFTEDDDRKVRELLTAAFKEAKEKFEKDEAKAQEVRSAALVKAVEYIAGDLKDTRVADAAPGDHDRPADHRQPAPHREGSGIGGYVCLGICVLGGVWLMIALFRALSGGMGGGGGGGPGGGGGGFFTSLLGGLFGAAAGMWMYNHFFGGGGMFGGGGSDAYAGDAGGGDLGGGDTGAGDWGGGSGDAGGFGGDFGGGGDFVGGGGDFGGDF